MIGRNDTTVTSVGRVTQTRAVEPAGDARQEEFTRSLATLVGKTLQATILSRMTDGTFLVQVAGSTARMALPANPQPGAEVPLTLVSVTPRPTFAVGGQDGATRTFAAFQSDPANAANAAKNAALAQGAAPPTPAQAAAARLLPQAGAQLPQTGAAAPRASGTGSLSHAAALLGKAPLGPSTPMAATEAYEHAPTLSQSARVISNVLGNALKSDHPPTVVAARMPVVAGPVIEPAKLAAALKDAIGASGLFYESHMAEWSAGERPLTALMREPQNQGERVARPPGDAAQLARLAQQDDGLPAREAADPHRLRPLGADGGMADRPATQADQATAQFINLQLSSQEQGKVAWQGQLWPGQELAWQISRDAPEQQARGQAGGDAEPAWRSGLRFKFPLLGDIAATVVMQGDQLHIQIQAGSDDVGSLLRRRSGELASALDAAGTPLASLTVADRPAKPAREVADD